MARDRDINAPEILFQNFKGINNVADANNLTVDELSEAENVDIDNEGKVKRRNGYTKKLTASDKIHSMWSNDRICLFIDGTTLKRLNSDYTASTIRDGVSSLPMSFVDVNENVYYSNATVNGYIGSDGNDNRYSTPTENYKVATKTGQHIEYYNGRLFIAKNETIWYTDAYNYGVIDMRTNAIEMKDEVTMLKAVDDGIYVSIGDINDRSSVIFLSGSTPSEMHSREVAHYGAIEGTAVKTKSAYVGDGNVGEKVIWTSRKGICLGENGGRFTNLTATKYEVTQNRYGAGQFKIVDGVPQYLTSLWT
jgi:archaellum component FlaF (FlaF/FlaG flagellin family)